MFDEEISLFVNMAIEKSGKMKKDIAKDMDITPTRMAQIVNRGDMKLSTLIRIIESSGQTLVIEPSDDNNLLKVRQESECKRCAYKKIAEQLENCDVDDGKLVI